VRPPVEAATEFVQLLNEDERFYSPSQRAHDAIMAHWPSSADMLAELTRELRGRPGVELAPAPDAGGIGLLIELEDGRLYAIEARTAYALVRFPGLAVANRWGLEECVRQRVLAACRLLGERIAAALPADLDVPVVRWWPGHMPAAIADENGVAAWFDYAHDAAVVRMRAIYFVSPPGRLKERTAPPR
jgi:hypothetical protein